MRAAPWFVAIGAIALAPACAPQSSAPSPVQCTGDVNACLSGTAAVQGFTATARQLQVNLFREFPATGAVPLTTVAIAPGGTFAFDGLAAWEHYYIEVQADFGQAVAPAVFVGPLGVPSSGPMDIAVPPVQLSVLEQSAPGGSMVLASALAYVFDPASGAPAQNETVSITVGGAPVPMVWTAVTPGVFGYSATFASGTAAQPAYAVSTAAPGVSTASSWQLVAEVPSFTPTLSGPASGATISADQPLTVSWPAQSASDEEIVQLFTQESGVWSSVFRSPVPDDSDAVGETIPASDVTPAGKPLLLNVAFVSGSCPPTANGCVVAETIAAEEITPQ
jgi:hypothetical protein